MRGSLSPVRTSMKPREAVAALAQVLFHCLTSVLGAILDLMPRMADQNSSRHHRSLWRLALYPTFSFERLTPISPTERVVLIYVQSRASGVNRDEKGGPRRGLLTGSGESGLSN